MTNQKKKPLKLRKWYWVLEMDGELYEAIHFSGKKEAELWAWDFSPSMRLEPRKVIIQEVETKARLPRREAK